MSNPVEPPKEPPKTPAITSANLPKPPTEPPKVEVDPNEPIVARPLVDADFTKLRPKNPLHRLYFGNRIANNGLRLEDLLARGFEIAHPDDVLTPDGKPLRTDSKMIKDGKIIRGDLICLKISRADYDGALLDNARKAAARVSRAGVAATGREKLNEALKEEGVGVKPQHRGKISFYNPSDSEIH